MSDACIEAGHAEPKIGRVYEVLLEDCCIGGTFTSKLTDITGDDEFPVYTFENGVMLDTHWGCQFIEVNEQDTQQTT